MKGMINFMRDIKLIKKDIERLSKSIINPDNNVELTNYYIKLEKKCVSLLNELEACKHLFTDKTEYDTYLNNINGTRVRINSQSLPLHVHTLSNVAKNTHTTSKKILLPTVTSKLFAKSTVTTTHPPVSAQKTNYLSIMISDNIRLTNLCGNAYNVLKNDELEAMSNIPKTIGIPTPQIYKIEKITPESIQTIYCCGYINMFKLATYVKNAKNDIPNNRDLLIYRDAVLSQMLNMKNINNKLINDFGNIGYLDTFKYSSLNSEKTDSGYQLITNNNQFNSKATTMFNNFITKEENMMKYIYTNETKEQISLSFFKIGNIINLKNKQKDSVTQYLLRTSKSDENHPVPTYLDDKTFWSNINFQKMREDSTYAKLVLRTIKSMNTSKSKYIGSFNSKNYSKYYKSFFNDLLNNSKNVNKNFATPDSIDVPL